MLTGSKRAKWLHLVEEWLSVFQGEVTADFETLSVTRNVHLKHLAREAPTDLCWHKPVPSLNDFVLEELLHG